MNTSEIVRKSVFMFRVKRQKLTVRLNKNRVSMLVYLASATVTLIVFLFVSETYNFSWKFPFAYTGDALLNLAVIKSLIDGDWSPYFDIVHSPYMAASFEFSLGDYPFAARMNFVLMKFLALGTRDPFLVYNLFYVGTFILSSWSALFVLRRFGVHYVIALTFGVLFSTLPFHFFRVTHLEIAAYFLVPLQILVVIWTWYKKPIFFKKVNGSFILSIQDRRDLLAAVILILSGVGAVYYAFFFCILCGLSGIASAIHRKNKVYLFSGILCCALVCGSLFISLMPYKIYSASRGMNPEVPSRTPVQAEIFGMKLTNILLPIPEHRLDVLKNLRGRYESATPAVEGASESLGSLGLIGFLICFFQIYLFGTAALLRKLAALQVTAVLFGTMGGFGALFALLCSPVIRSYNRISIFIAFISLATLALLLESLRKWVQKRENSGALNRKLAKAAVYSGTIFVLLLGVLDQTSPAMKIQSVQDELASDHDFVMKIEQKSALGAMVLQLPYQAFPESEAVLRMENFSHFKGYLHSKSLKWSYGTMSGRQEDLITRVLCSFPPDIEKIKNEGFSGIYIDRYGYPDDAKMLEDRLSLELHQIAMVSKNGRLSFFNLVN